MTIGCRKPPARGRRSLPTFVAILAILGIGSGPVAAQTPPEVVGIRIVDAPTTRADDPRARQYIVDHVAPGATITRRVEVSNDTAQVQAVKLYAAAGSIDSGKFVFGAGRAVNELTTWTTVEPAVVSPVAGGRSLATVVISIPHDASPGERYAVVWAELPAAVPAGGGIETLNRVGVRIYLSVGSGGEPASDFGITALAASRDAGGRPAVTATISNTGGRAVDLNGELRLTDGPGGLAAGPFDARMGTTLGTGQVEPVLVVLDKAIPAGPWTARIVMRSGLTEREATATITFPRAAASSSAPVPTRTAEADPSRLSPIVIGGVAVAGLVLLCLLLVRRRRPPTISD